MKGKRKNRGFGLIELIVALAILGISGGAIATFMVTSQRSYASGTAETDLQYEAQLVANQLQDLIIDTAKGISYEYSGTLATGSAGSGLLLDDTEIAADTVVSTKTLYVYDEEHYYLIKWDNTVHELYYSDYLSTEVPAEGDGRAELLAEYVTGFSVDLRDVSENRTVKYTITFTKESSGKEYSTTHKIKLRNDVLVNEDMSNIYEEPAETPEVTSVDITPTDLYLWPGESTSTTTADDTLSVTPTWKDNKSGSYYAPSWSYVGKTSSATAVDASGELTLGADETGSTIDDEAHRIDVIASVSGQADTAKVGVRWIDEISLTAQQLTSGTATYADISLNGQTVQEGSVGYRIRLSNFTGSHLKDTPDGTDLWTGSDTDATRTSELKAMGGVTISVEDGDELITLTTTTAAGAVTGDLTFYVNSGIDWTKYSDTNPATVTIRFTSNRTQYANGAAYHPYGEITFTVTEKTSQVIDTTTGWKRGGLLKIDLSQLDLPDGFFWTDSDGIKHPSQTIDVQVNYYMYDKDGNVKVIDGSYTKFSQAGNTSNAPYDSERGMYYESHGDGTMVSRMYWRLSDPLTTYLYLNPYATPYTKTFYNNYYAGIDWVEITLIVNGYNGKDYTFGSYKVDVAPVKFSYSKSASSDGWLDAGEDINVYVTDDAKKDQSVRVYYKLEEGWEPDWYTVDTDRFVFTLDDSTVINYNQLKSYFTVTSGNDSNGYYIDIQMKKELLSQTTLTGKTIKVSYEENPFAGSKWCYEKAYDNMVECDGSILINVLSEGNIDKEYYAERKTNIYGNYISKYDRHTFSLPSIPYCPSPSELKELKLKKGDYYWINDSERFLIGTDAQGNYEITYQKKHDRGSEWGDCWTKDNGATKCYMSWQSETKTWKYTKEQLK